MTWRLAHSLVVLRDECDTLAPGRSRASDGTIGDAAHASRSSDHNPYIKDHNGVGVVRAFDATHDPDGGLDAYLLAEHLRQLGKAGDKRIRYVISNGRIASARGGWAWRPYHGANSHSQHTHVSVVEDQAGYDSNRPWGLTGEDDVIHYNRRSHEVYELQLVANQAARDTGGWLATARGKPLTIDGHAGPITFAAVIELLDRAAQEPFAHKAAVDLRGLLGDMPNHKLREVGISATMRAVLCDLAAAR